MGTWAADPYEGRGPRVGASLPAATLPDAADLDDSLSTTMAAGERPAPFVYQEVALPTTRRSMFDLAQSQPVAEDAVWFQCPICGARVTDEWSACPSCGTRLYSPTTRRSG